MCAVPLKLRASKRARTGPPFLCGLFVRQVGMAGLYVVLAGMKDERLAALVSIMDYFAEENHVIAALKFSNDAADKVSGSAFQQRAAFDRVAAVKFGEAILDLLGKSARKRVLIGTEDVDRKMACFGEIGEFGRQLSEAPEDERRIQRDGCERIDGEPDAAAALIAPGDDRDSGGELAESGAEIAAVECGRLFCG